MQRLRHRFAAACALAAVFAATAALAAGERAKPFAHGLLFRLDRPGVAPSFVFGTMHSADPRVTALPPPVADAFRSARTFALEGRPAGSEVARSYAAAQLDDGRRLADYFDRGDLAAIRAALGPSAPSDEVLMRLKPWAVLLKLSEETGGTVGATLDELLLADALRRRLTIVGLELPDEQIAAFDAIPIATQVALVRFAALNREAMLRDHDAALAAWLGRDLEGLARLAGAPGRRNPEVAPHFAELARHLIDNRSAQMAHRLFLPLRTGRVFVAVGALHLYGSQGLLAMLRDQGYRVRAIY